MGRRIFAAVARTTRSEPGEPSIFPSKLLRKDDPVEDYVWPISAVIHTPGALSTTKPMVLRAY